MSLPSHINASKKRPAWSLERRNPCTPLILLKFLAKALGNAFGGGIAGDLLVDVLPEVAKDVWEWWSKGRSTEQCRAEIEVVAQAGAEEVRQQAAEIVKEVMPDKPLEVRQAVEMYLNQVPASIRRSLRRSSDPTGTTVPPDLAPRKADDLLRLLPPKSSRFKPGGHPLFGVDWELEVLLGWAASARSGRPVIRRCRAWTRWPSSSVSTLRRQGCCGTRPVCLTG